MNGVAMIKSAIQSSHFWFDGTVRDVTAQQANFVPPGVAHPIGELVVHVLNSEDMIVNQFFCGTPTVWDAGGWEAKLGYGSQFTQDAATARAMKVDLEALQPYKDAVFANTNAWLNGLSDADLDKEIDLSAFGQGKRALGQVALQLFIANTFVHTGEISTLKGLQSAKGYPF
jgi:hypothetical protein